jgi:hypothetical protein
MSGQNIVVKYETNLSSNETENISDSWIGKHKLSLFRSAFYATIVFLLHTEYVLDIIAHYIPYTFYNFVISVVFFIIYFILNSNSK